ncbi:MAG: protein kinase [Eubacterium sp.]|nr:protein kinase [Eubacterium sp.]
MNHYFEEGESFTWIRDQERDAEPLVVPLIMLQEKYRTGSKQALLAEDIRTGKQYFVKVLFCADMEQVYVEKESKARMYSPYIIRIYGGMLDEENQRFITLVEYIDQKDLSELIRTEGLSGGSWNEKMKIRHKIAVKVLYGIEHYMTMYQSDPMVHRDIKPENVLASPDGEVVKIIDFDWVHLHESNVTVMNHREQKGTPGYVDPAFWNSFFCRKAMDIYSAGLLLYFIYTGNHHFYGSEEIHRYMVGDDYAYHLKDMPGVDPRLYEIIAKMIAREGDRYTDISQVIDDMKAILLEKGQWPALPERLEKKEGKSLIRFTYRVGDISYSPYLRQDRFLPVIYGKKQERSRNGPVSAHILSFYRVGETIKVMILHENCRRVDGRADDTVREGDQFLYEGTVIEVVSMRLCR